MDVKVMPMVFSCSSFTSEGSIRYSRYWSTPTRRILSASRFISPQAASFSRCLIEDTARRFAIIRSAYIGAAVIAAILGMLGYFKAFPGSEVFLMNDRAVSTFKDPNITGPSISRRCCI